MKYGAKPKSTPSRNHKVKTLSAQKRNFIGGKKYDQSDSLFDKFDKPLRVGDFAYWEEDIHLLGRVTAIHETSNGTRQHNAVTLIATEDNSLFPIGAHWWVETCQLIKMETSK
jgi:hypothetical protein